MRHTLYPKLNRLTYSKSGIDCLNDRLKGKYLDLIDMLLATTVELDIELSIQPDSLNFVIKVSENNLRAILKPTFEIVCGREDNYLIYVVTSLIKTFGESNGDRFI